MTYHSRRLATKLKHNRLQILCRLDCDDLAYSDTPRELRSSVEKTDPLMADSRSHAALEDAQ